MKSYYIILFLFFFSTTVLSNENPFEFHGYLRSSLGSNSKGKDLTCFRNGQSSSEFRLGNECDSFLEFRLKYNHLPVSNELPYFFTQINLAKNYLAHKPWEDWNEDKSTEYPFQLIEAYVEGGRFFSSPISFWAGKRYWRGPGIYMNDFYYSYDFSGNGAGALNLPLFITKGQFDFSFLRQINSSKLALAINAWHVKTKKFLLMSDHQIDFWASYASSNGQGKDKNYLPVDGYAFGLEYQKNYSKGAHQLGLFYGKSLLEGLNLYGKNDFLTKDDSYFSHKKANRLRFVSHLTYDLSQKLSFHQVAVLEQKKTTSGDKFTVASIGFHPVFFFNDHFQIVSQLGFSSYGKENDFTTYKLMRVSLAPQISPKLGIWTRPVIRAFVAWTFWSDTNKGSVGGTDYAERNSGGNYGISLESWF